MTVESLDDLNYIGSPLLTGLSKRQLDILGLADSTEEFKELLHQFISENLNEEM